MPLISHLLILQRLEVPERCQVTCSEEASVIVDFMCQFNWIMEYTEIWLNIMSGCVSEGISRWDWHLY